MPILYAYLGYAGRALDTEIIVEDFLQSVDKRQGVRQKLRYMRWQSKRIQLI